MSKSFNHFKRQFNNSLKRRFVEDMITNIKSKSDLNLFTQGSVYWYENPFNNKEDYKKSNRNQDFISTRPVVIVEKAIEIKGFSLNSVIIVPISTSPKRIGIHIDMGNEYDCKILPYNISTVKVKYLNDYKGHISQELLNEVLQAVDYHLGRTTVLPKYLKDISENKSFDLNLFDHDDSEDFIFNDDIVISPAIINDEHQENDSDSSPVEFDENDTSSSEIKISSKISLSRKYNDIYDTVHPVMKIKLNKMSVSDVKDFFNKYNVAWDTAKRIKMKIAEEISSVGLDTYCMYSLRDRIKNLKVVPNEKIKFLEDNDIKLFNLCKDIDLAELFKLSLDDIRKYKDQFLLNDEKSKDNKLNENFDESILKIKSTESMPG